MDIREFFDIGVIMYATNGSGRMKFDELLAMSHGEIESLRDAGVV